MERIHVVPINCRLGGRSEATVSRFNKNMKFLSSRHCLTRITFVDRLRIIPSFSDVSLASDDVFCLSFVDQLSNCSLSKLEIILFKFSFAESPKSLLGALVFNTSTEAPLSI